jgi:hypothetical protein
MAHPRSRRLRLLESLRRTINEMLHARVRRAANAKGHGSPINTSTIYTSASREAPELLDQLLLIHQRVNQEQGRATLETPPDQLVAQGHAFCGPGCRQPDPRQFGKLSRLAPRISACPEAGPRR